MFQKLVAIEPVSLVLSAEKALYSFADEVVMYSDIPAGDNEIIARIGDADAVLLSYTSQINRYILERCPNVRYIGMCCSLYSPESANVDIRYANERGITVTGIRDYGDEASQSAPLTVLPIFTPSEVVSSEKVIAKASACSTRRIKSAPERMLLHWSSPPS